MVDTAGNAGPLDSQAVTIDTAAPTATVDITAIADDTGTSSSDFITSDTVLTVSGTNGGAWSPARRCRSAATAAPPGWM